MRRGHTPPKALERGERLQRVMADAGVASRRECEEMIEQGRVRVNGRVVDHLPVFVEPGRDRIIVDGRPLPAPERKIYVMINKPARTLVSTRDDEHGARDARRTVLDLVKHPAAPRLFPVGRLEFEATGLVLLTNDGELANRLTHPRHEIPRVYEATVRGEVDERWLAEIRKAARKAERRAIRENPAVPAPRLDLTIAERRPGRTTLELTVTRGAAADVRDLLGSVGCPVRSLERVAIGPLRLRGLARGAWRELDRKEVTAIKRAMRAGGGGKPPAPRHAPATPPQRSVQASAAARESPPRVRPRTLRPGASWGGGAHAEPRRAGGAT